MKPAIRVENLSKSYRIGARRGADYRTLREAIMTGLGGPWRQIRQRVGGAAGEGAPADEFWALDDVSFEVQPGEVVGIIGRNGAGKSTLLKILSRITEPTRGRAEFRGRIGSLLEVGTGFHPELTGRENIYLNGSILGMSRREVARKFDEIVAFSEIEQFLDTPVKRYSSGMYVRLAFAVAAHLEPEILIIDEVLAVGDAAFQKKCLGKMEDIAGEGRTVLFVTHNMPVVLRICSRAIFLQHGRVVVDGPSAPVVQDYLSEDDIPQDDICDLTRQNRPHQVNGNARLVSCRMTTPSKEIPWVMDFGDTLQLEVGVSVMQRLNDLELGLALCTATGFEVASSLSLDKIGVIGAGPGMYTFHVAFPSLVLAPGRYCLGLGLRAERGMEDNLPEAVRFEVQPTAESSRRLIHLRRGAVIPELECRVKPGAVAASN